MYQSCEFKSRRGKNTTLTAQKSNYTTVLFNFQTYVIFSSNLVSQVTLRSIGTDIVYGCHLLSCLYNIHYFLWLYNDFFIILCNILKIPDLDCCQIIKLSIYVPSTRARHISYVYLLIFLSRQGNTSIIEAPFVWSGCGRVVKGAEHNAKWFILQCINGVSSNPVEGRTQMWQLKHLIITLFGLIFRRL